MSLDYINPVKGEDFKFKVIYFFRTKNYFNVALNQIASFPDYY